MLPFLAIGGTLAGVIITGIVSYAVARRGMSGDVGASKAEDLWGTVTTELARQGTELVALRAENSSLRAENAALRAKDEVTQARILDLERRLSSCEAKMRRPARG